MFDIWLNRNREIVDEIIKESNLKEIVKKKLDTYMLTDEFAEHLDNTVKNEIKKTIEEYVSDYMFNPNEWDKVANKVKQIIREQNN